MKRVFVVVALAAISVGLLAAEPAASNPVFAGQCGIKPQQTVWAEYGWPALLPILGKPGTLLASTTQSSTDYSAAARRLGAATYAFDLKMNKKVGTPTAPADPSTIEAQADTEYGHAVARSGGCATPLIVENELFGASIPTPWTTSTEQYRANVLALLQDLAAKGAHPVLLINKSPYGGSSDAVQWWRSVSKVADIVRELKSSGVTVQVHDPLALAEETKHEYGIDLMPMGALNPADAVILAVAHEPYAREGWRLIQRLLRGGAGVVFDVRGMLDRAAKPEGIDLWRL